ncbi:hypothetical protein FHU36_006033 [Nonomuraea muscovyensis]|uniref:Uncharacterized protein n=1 Tax=Nonomuraea muscovyensis TaxID=1124761 RepID=A0A7X0EZ67_9ACTN|nr:hypothetical protein [Nonomuraea muscovyensis]MBB6349488.1 hypothetical protein [Nonomuraea muscovyensis]
MTMLSAARPSSSPSGSSAGRGAGVAGGLRRLARVALATLAIVASAGCAAGEAKGSYKPALLPVKLEWDSSGVKVTGESSLVTPIGVFSIGAAYSLAGTADDALYVIIRNARKSPADPSVAGFDHIYKVKSGTGEFTAVVNGTAVIQIVDRQVLIDVTHGTVRTVEFRGAEAAVQERAAGIDDRWRSHWETCFYSPMALSRWAYDDSTMGSLYGLGFAWFLARLALAIVLGLVDLLLVAATFLAAVAYMFFGPTARNIVYGVEALVFVFFAFAGWAGLRLD